MRRQLMHQVKLVSFSAKTVTCSDTSAAEVNLVVGRYVQCLTMYAQTSNLEMSSGVVTTAEITLNLESSGWFLVRAHATSRSTEDSPRLT